LNGVQDQIVERALSAPFERYLLFQPTCGNPRLISPRRPACFAKQRGVIRKKFAESRQSWSLDDLTAERTQQILRKAGPVVHLLDPTCSASGRPAWSASLARAFSAFNRMAAMGFRIS